MKIRDLRTHCNQLGISCRGKDGKFLPKHLLESRLIQQVGGAHTGAQFVINFIGREWRRLKTTGIPWTLIIPDEAHAEKVLILYQCSAELGLFANLQIIFQIEFHERHPFEAPSIKVLTPTGRMQTNQSICIDGLTAWHPESWSAVGSFTGIIERFMIAFLDIEGVTHGAGFEYATPSQIRRYVANSPAWNLEHYPAIVAAFKEQQDDVLALAFAQPAQKKQRKQKKQQTQQTQQYEQVAQDTEYYYPQQQQQQQQQQKN